MNVKCICVCIPGDHFSYRWMMAWTELFAKLCGRFHVGMVFATSNNIYLVREQCLKAAFCNPDGEPDYLLWIDSDNPPSAAGFDHLIGCLEASQAVSVIGGWYRYFDPQSLEVRVAAGCLEDPYRNIREEEVLNAEHIIEVPFVGLGFCLMRAQVVKDIGIENCFEPYFYHEPKNRRFATDDDGFGFRAKEAGHRIFLHPAVFVPHEKPMHVPASFENRHEIPVLKEL